MKKDKKHTVKSCPEWANQIQAIIDLPEDDELYQLWASHRKSCLVCEEAYKLEESFKRNFRELPDPGQARIADTVMMQVRGLRHTRSHGWLKEFGWGVAGTVAGVFLGFYLAPMFDRTPEIEASAGYELMLTEISEGLDPLIDEFFSESGGSW